MVCESWPSAAPRSLAAVSLLRPARFDPSGQFDNLHVSSPAAGVFHLTLPDGELAYVDLRDAPANSVRLGDFLLEGTELRLARLRPDGSQLCAVNLLRAGGLLELERPATLQLRRDKDNQIDLITDAGLALAPAVLDTMPCRIQVQTTGGELIDVTGECRQAAIPDAVVQNWSGRNERSLIHFRMTP